MKLDVSLSYWAESPHGVAGNRVPTINVRFQLSDCTKCAASAFFRDVRFALSVLPYQEAVVSGLIKFDLPLSNRKKLLDLLKRLNGWFGERMCLDQKELEWLLRDDQANKQLFKREQLDDYRATILGQYRLSVFEPLKTQDWSDKRLLSRSVCGCRQQWLSMLDYVEEFEQQPGGDSPYRQGFLHGIDRVNIRHFCNSESRWIMRIISGCSTIKTFTLGRGFDAGKCINHYFIELLARAPNMAVLNVSSSDVSMSPIENPRHLRRLAVAICHAPNLNELNLSGNPIGDEGLCSLLAAMRLRKGAALTRLKINNCSIGEEGRKSLLRYWLQNTAFCYVLLNDVEFIRPQDFAEYFKLPCEPAKPIYLQSRLPFLGGSRDGKSEKERQKDLKGLSAGYFSSCSLM